MSTVKKSVFWSVGQLVLTIGLSGLKMFILVRYLTPKELGVLALLNFAIGVLELLSVWGLDTAMYRKKSLDQDQRSTLFWMYVGVGLLVFIFASLPYLFSIALAEGLGWYLCLIGTVLLFSSPGRLMYAETHRGMHFKGLFFINFIPEILSVLVCYCFLLKNYGVEAAVYGFAISSLLKYGYCFFSGIFKGAFPYFRFRKIEAMAFFRLGTYSLGAKGLAQVSSNLDILLIEHFLGLDTVGKYNVCKQLAFQPFRFSGPLIQKVFTPYLAAFADHAARIRKGYLQLVRINSLFNFIVLLVFVLIADPLVMLMYGEMYRSLVEVCQLLGLYYYFQTLNSPVMILPVIKGITSYNFIWYAVIVAVMSVFVGLGLPYGIKGVAVSLVIMRLVLYYPSWYYFGKRLTHVKFVELLRANFLALPEVWKDWSNLRGAKQE